MTIIPGLPNPHHMRRYGDVVRLLAKYGRIDLFKDSGFLEEELRPAEGAAHAEELAADLEKMGPTFIKLGQLLSTRADILPVSYLKSLSRLQDDVAPVPFDKIEAIIAVELGVRMSRAFSEFEHTPLAAASLGQVHRATLRDGRAVAVKVQRPGIRKEVMGDLDSLGEIAAFLDRHTDLGRYELRNLIEQFRRTLLLELDYRQEAQNLTRLREALKGFDKLYVPAPIDGYTTSRVLTMDYVHGRKITQISGVVLTDINGEELAEQLFRAYLHQVLVDGFFHADPHPGNVFLTDDHRVALLDLGMAARIAPRMQGYLLQLLLAIAEGRSEDAAAVAIKIGDAKPDFDERGFKRRIADLVGRQQDISVKEMQMGGVVLEVTQISADAGIRVPPELAMLGKMLLNLDLVGRALDDKFNPNASIRRNAADVLRGRMLRSLSPSSLFSNVLELKDLAERLPERVNKVLDAISENKLRLHIDAIDETELITGLQKIANRITLGLILAALIVGAAMLMRVETEFRIFGYPALAIVCFLFAAGGGVTLAFNILFHDRRQHRRDRSKR